MMYPDEKINIIQQYENDYIINFINEIKGKERSDLNNKALVDFVPKTLRHVAVASKNMAMKLSNVLLMH